MREVEGKALRDIVQYGLKAVLDLLIPRKCIVCEKVLDVSEKHLCRDCLDDIPHTYYWLRKFNPMADKFNALIQERMEEETLCTQSVSLDNMMTDQGSQLTTIPKHSQETSIKTSPCHEGYAYSTALYFYRADSGYSHISRQLKYHGNIPAGKFFGRQLGLRLAQAEHLSDVDAVIPIPLHWTRKWSRGYNQAEVIAREVATTLGVALRTDILERSRRTRTQTKLSIEGKAANVQGAFRVRPDLLDRFRITDHNNDLSLNTHKRPQPCSPKADVSDPAGLKHLLIVDDVFTTGSTLHACFVALRSVFPPSVRISVATLAFVGEA